LKLQHRSTWDVICRIIFLLSLLRFWAPVSRVRSPCSVNMIMRILTMIVIIFIARCTEKIESVTPGTYRQLKFWNPRHDTEYIAWGSYCLYKMPLVRGSVAGQLRPQGLPTHRLQTTKFDSSQYSTLYKMKYCFIRVKSKFRSAIRLVHCLIVEFFKKWTAEFWQQATTADCIDHTVTDNVRIEIYLAIVETAVPAEFT
jgi:hypothetical protein